MRPSPTSNFFKFTLVFLVFISISFGVAFSVNMLEINNARVQAAAAAQEAMLAH